MSNISFIFSKILGVFASPGSVTLLLLLLGFLLLFSRWQKKATWLLGITISFCIVIALLPVDEWLLTPLERAFPVDPVLPSQVEGIVILGGAIDTLVAADWQQSELNGAGDRMTAGVMLARRYPNARILFSGGSGLVRHPNLREAEFARDFFLSQNLPENRVFYESASRTTYENAVYSRQVAEPEEESVWVLVTSASHMPRAIGSFCEQGWSMVPWPVDHRTSPSRLWRVEFDFAGNLAALDAALHEYAGLLVYRLSGKTPALFPKNC